MNLTEDHLRQIVASIWSTQLRLELRDSEVEALGDLLADDSTVCGVELSGDFDGVLVQRCSRALSMLAASAAFAETSADLGATDVRDTISEIAHMTAGNIKSLLPGRTAVALLQSPESDSPRGDVVAEVGFTLDGEPLVVTVIRSTSGS